MDDMAARNFMHQKLIDAVAWLDREIENLGDCSPGYFIAAQIERLEELRNDLVETINKARGQG